MANLSPKKTPRREKTPGRYIGFNADPENVGTRTGKTMPQNVQRDAHGFEDPEQFIGGSSPRFESEAGDDFDSMRTTTTRAGLAMSERTIASSRTVVRTELMQEKTVATNGHGRKSLAGLISRRAQIDNDDEDEEEAGNNAVDGLLSDGLASIRRVTNRTGNHESLEDMDLSTISDTPTKSRGLPHRPRPSASPASSRSRPALSQLAPPPLEGSPERNPDGTFDEHSFQDDEDPGFAESPSVRAAKSGIAKSRSQLSKRKNTAISKRLARVGESSERHNGSDPNGAGQADGLDARIDEPSTNAGPSRRPRNSAAAERRTTASPIIDDFFGDEANDEPFGEDDMNDIPEQAHDSAEEVDDAPVRRISNRTKVANARAELSAVKQPRGRRGKQKSPASANSGTDDFETMPDTEALPKRSQAATKTKRGRPPPAKKPVRPRQPSTAQDGDRTGRVRPLRTASQGPEEHVERVDEAARTRGRLRSQAERHAPLRYWMGEKPLLTRSAVPKSADAADVVPELSGWLTKTAVVQPLGGKKPATKRKRDASGPVQGGRKRRGQLGHHEDYTGWENETEASAIVATYMPKEGKDQEYVRRVACTADMVKVKPISNGEFGYQKIFGEEEFFAAGLLHIPVGAQKSAKNSRDNAYAFHVFQGCVKVLVHKYTFIIAEGGQFMVPRGNIYSVTNISQQEVKIFFSQARRLKPLEVKAADEDDSQQDIVGQDVDGQSEDDQQMEDEADTNSEAA